MQAKPLNEIKWATPQNPRGLWANCIICGKDIREMRTRKCTCSDACATLHQRNLWNKQYAEKMAADPNYARKQSARQYSRIKADPEKMEAKRIAQNERMQMPNYKESAQKSQAKYRAKPETKAKIAKRIRKYRDDNIESISEIETKYSQKRSAERARLKTEEPEKYAELLQKERMADQQRKAEKRLAELQKNIEKMVNKDE